MKKIKYVGVSRARALSNGAFLAFKNNFRMGLEFDEKLYPIDGLTRGELALATLSYVDLCAASDGRVSWGDGDSLDRERVRDFVINRRAI